MRGETMGSLRPLMNLASELPPQFFDALNFAIDHCHQITRRWPVPHFPAFFHAEQMGIDSLKLGLNQAAVEAAIVHDLPLMTDVTFSDLESVVSQETVDLIHEWTPPSHVLQNTELFNIDEHLVMLSRSNTTVQTLVFLDLVQTAPNVGNHQLDIAEQFADLLKTYERALQQIHPKLMARAEFIEKWLRSRVYEKQVAEYKDEKAEIEYIRPRG